MATTTGTPNLLAFSICFLKLAQPFSRSSRFCSCEENKYGISNKNEQQLHSKLMSNKLTYSKGIHFILNLSYLFS